MIKKLIKKLIKRALCPHLYWRSASSLEMGSYCRGVIVCKKCGKRKLQFNLKADEILDDNPLNIICLTSEGEE